MSRLLSLSSFDGLFDSSTRSRPAGAASARGRTSACAGGRDAARCTPLLPVEHGGQHRREHQHHLQPQNALGRYRPAPTSSSSIILIAGIPLPSCRSRRIRTKGGHLLRSPWLSPELEAYTPLPFPNPFPKASVEHELQKAGIRETRHFQRVSQWARLGSNQRPPACEAGALPLSYAPRPAEDSFADASFAGVGSERMDLRLIRAKWSWLGAGRAGLRAATTRPGGPRIRPVAPDWARLPVRASASGSSRSALRRRRRCIR
jgi:hypothetical protein